DLPEWLVATLASDATEGEGVLPNFILPLRPGSRVVGPARVALMGQDDNLVMRKGMDESPMAGGVVVVGGGGGGVGGGGVGWLLGFLGVGWCGRGGRGGGRGL